MSATVEEMASENEFNEDVGNLIKLFRLHSVVSFDINEIKCTAGSSSGDNYMSVVKRIQIKGKAVCLTNGNKQREDHNLSLIIKRQIPSVSRRELFRCDEAFKNEICAYKHVIPLLEQYGNKKILPKCYFAGTDDLGDIIVLEDLRDGGFYMHNRLLGLDVHYCELVMKQLAKLHAASIAAKQLNHEVFREKSAQIQEIVYCKEGEAFYKRILNTSIEESIHSLKESNVDGCLTEPIRLIENLQHKIYHKLQSDISNTRDCLKVVCHGDLWINNIMFRVDLDSDDAVRFFDLQAMRYTSPVFDILHFIYTSTKRDLRDAHTQRLLETYCIALSANLEAQFENAKSQLVSLRDTFSLHNITQDYYERVLYGLAISMWILPAVTFDPNHIPDLDIVSEKSNDANNIKCTHMLTPEYHSRLKDVVLEFYHNGFLDSFRTNE